ncbi:TniQ family protein (plasmid) [Streptomyces sp. NBC_00873]|uniref:TniQ family protein n=1 Tax=unclassified Streptomyces TaxID=2593676 RepID=UPI002F90B0FD|nr:TniQ family protein [Streptomyces sp. NBC_00873]WTA49303.1 TniQ family protein [Streptomyces sp. NBC_00842]
MNPVRRWPLHPQPGLLESLSSWLDRLARLYEMPVKDLLTRNIGLVDLDVPADLDYDPPMAMLTALAERTGTELAHLRAMTLAGWEPWLFDKLTVPIQDTQPMFDAYVRDNSVLLAPGEACTNRVNRWKRWPGPWFGAWPLHRACPGCAADPGRGRTLLWRLPLMTGCVEHGCRLEDATAVELQVTLGGEGPEVPLEEPLATVDRYTYEGLTTGRVTLPGRSVHAGVWFRLLRCLLDEVSLSLSGRSSHGRATLEQVWQAAGREERAGLTTWRPYEHLEPSVQEAMLHAAGTALQLVAEGTVIAFGRLAPTLRREHRHVYDGDRPSPHRSSWQEAMAEMEAALDLARTDRDAARQLLILLTLGCRTLDRFEEERAFLFGVGVPAEFIPTARDLGRVDLA